MLAASGDKTDSSRIVLQGANECARDVFLARTLCLFSLVANLHERCAVALDSSCPRQLWFLIHIDEVNVDLAREIRIQIQLILGPLEAGALVKIGDLCVLFETFNDLRGLLRKAVAFVGG